MAIAAVGLCSIIYLAWLLPAFSVRTKVGKQFPVLKDAHLHWNSKPRRLVVFGDSLSDDGQNPTISPLEDPRPKQHEAQRKVWTEWLCFAASQQHDFGVIIS